jgi:predicted TIM-barrel fold metal-dependent hydrolase
MKYIDFHTRIFPDQIAKQAMDAPAAGSGTNRPCTDGTLQGLLDSMQRANISASLVANVAAKPSQMYPVLEHCKEIRSSSIHPLVSFHPSNSPEEVEEMLGQAQREKIRGVKLHPQEQNFNIDDKWMYGFYELIASCGLFVIFQTGYDVAYPGNTQADVERVKKIADWFRDLTIVCTHVGGWKQWERISCLSGCANVHTETSMTLGEVSDEEFIRLINHFDEDRVLFGSGSPWMDQQEALKRTLGLNISDARKEKLLYKNAVALLKLT